MENKPVKYHPKRLERLRFWSSHVENYEKTPLTRREYCQRHNLSYHSFTYWRRELKKEGLLKEPEVSVCEEFVRLDSGQMDLSRMFSGSDSGYSIRLKRRDYSVELNNEFSPIALRDLLSVLDQM